MAKAKKAKPKAARATKRAASAPKRAIGATKGAVGATNKAARVKRLRRIKMPIASVVEIKIPKDSAPLIVHKAPDTIHVVTAPRDVATKQGWWDYLFGDR